MKQFIGTSDTANVKEAVNGLTDPKLLIFFCCKETFQEAAKQLNEMYPNIPTIGCAGMSYYGMKRLEKGMAVIGFLEQITITANILEKASIMPLKYIQRVIDCVQEIKAEERNTICIDFCTGNDTCIVSTLNMVLQENHISLIGGTADEYVSFNGVIYKDACVFALIKNNTGKIKAYRENIYKRMEREKSQQFVVTKTDPKEKIIYELNGKPAAEVYQRALQIPDEKVAVQTFQNPLGRQIGTDVYIMSIQELVTPGALRCYKQANAMDVLTILELDDYKQVVQQTISHITDDFSHISMILSVNCLFRYLLFQEQSFLTEYLQMMNLSNNHIGLVGLGEHYNTQHANQTMSCVVFE